MSRVDFLKAELIQTRSAVNNSGDQKNDALFSVELPVDDIFEKGTASSFDVIELIAYRIKIFRETIADDLDTDFLDQVKTSGYIQRTLYLDTAVPDASKPLNTANFKDTDNRWLASSTNVHFARHGMYGVNFEDTTNGTGGASISKFGSPFRNEWMFATDPDARGPYIVTPRLIIRYSLDSEWSAAAPTALSNVQEIMEFQMMYRNRRISKADMFSILRRQQAQETLLRSGTAAFP